MANLGANLWRHCEEAKPVVALDEVKVETLAVADQNCFSLKRHTVYSQVRCVHLQDDALPRFLDESGQPWKGVWRRGGDSNPRSHKGSRDFESRRFNQTPEPLRNRSAFTFAYTQSRKSNRAKPPTVQGFDARRALFRQPEATSANRSQ
jgi:hypothetical protein